MGLDTSDSLSYDYNAANAKRRHYIGLMLGQRRRR